MNFRVHILADGPASMLKGAFTSPKIRTLAARLGIPFPHAVGICGMLWNFTADHAPRGDVGKHDDHQIAMAVEWTGDPGELIAALVAVRLLDRCEKHRLLVHDWKEHAPRYVHATLARKQQNVIECPTAVRTVVATVVPSAVVTTSSSTSSSTSTSTSSSTSDESRPVTGGDVVTARQADRSRPPKASRIQHTATGWEGITDADRDLWASAYPSVDLDRELAKATAWLAANPTRAGKRNWAKFVVNWLARAHDRGGGRPAATQQPARKTPTEKAEEAAARAAEYDRQRLASGDWIATDDGRIIRNPNRKTA